MNKASFYVMFYVRFCYFEKSLSSSSGLLLDIPYLVLTLFVKDPILRGPISQFADLKFLDYVTYEGHVGITASIILSLFLLHVFVCIAVIFEEPLIEKHKENI